MLFDSRRGRGFPRGPPVMEREGVGGRRKAEEGSKEVGKEGGRRKEDKTVEDGWPGRKEVRIRPFRRSASGQGRKADLRAGPVMLPLSMDHSRVWEVIDVGNASEREGRGFVA